MRPTRLLFPFVFLILFLAGCGGGLDTSGLANTEAARLILVSLGTDDHRVQTAIDWDVFRVDDKNYYDEYHKQTTDQQKAGLRDTVVDNVALGMTQGGYNPAILSNWTQVSEDANWIVVTATDNRGAKTTMTFIKRNGQRLLAAIDYPH